MVILRCTFYKVFLAFCILVLCRKFVTKSSFLLIVCFGVNLETESRLRDLTFRSSDRRSLRGSATSLRLKSRIRSHSALRDLQEINLNDNYLNCIVDFFDQAHLK